VLRRCVWSRNIKNGCSIYIYDISHLRVKSYLCLSTRFAKLFFSFSKIWTCFYKLFRKRLLIISVGYIHFFTAGNIVNTWARKCYLRYGWPSRSTCATHSCVFVVCCCCSCGNYRTNWIIVNIAHIVIVSCIGMSFYFFCFVPHNILRSLRRKRWLEVSLVTMNQIRRKNKNKWRSLTL